MCSVDDSEKTHMDPKIPTRSKLCMKCGETATVVIRMNDPVCGSCFDAYVIHKFRAAIGKSKVIRDGEKVFVAFSGGQSSSCLLRLITDGLGENVHKKLRFQPSLVYVDDGAATCQTSEERDKNLSQILSAMIESGFPSYITSLKESCESPDDQSKSLTFSKVSNQNDCKKFYQRDLKDDKLRDLIGSVKSMSEKENLLKILRYNLLLNIARQTGHTKVMCADTASRLAVKLLSGIAQGRGGHIPFDTGFADSRNSDVMFVRPLKDFTVKEVALFNLYHNVSSVITPSFTTMDPPGSSIERLTETFVTGLQNDYLATVSNITRTGEKLEFEDKGGLGSTEQCALCQAPLDTCTGISSALNALSFSQAISHKLPDGNIPSEGQQNIDVDSLSERLCYGCCLTVHDMDNIQTLPETILSKLSAHTREAMQEKIQDCLLDDV